MEHTILNPNIFRAYDIRGVVGDTLNDDVIYKIGQAIGSIAKEQSQQTIVVGHDGRCSSPSLSAALINGLCASGRDVIDIGRVPTPVLYFACHFLQTHSGVMLTGSHNPPEYNGLKIMLGAKTLFGHTIKAIYHRIEEGTLSHGQGTLRQVDIREDYINRITADNRGAPGQKQKIVVDAGNGVVGPLAPVLLRALGHEVIECYCEVDGRFPNHPPDPSQPENLQELINRVRTEQADIGFAFDGDGDRLGVVDGAGHIIWPDRQLTLLAEDVLTRHPGQTIIFDVKCSRHLKDSIESNGGTALMWKTGHSFIKNKMQEIGAPLAGEMSGHIFFKERWYGFDDALYAAVRILEIVTRAGRSAQALFAAIPEAVSTPELRIALAEREHEQFMREIRSKMAFDDVEVIDIDGLRIEFPDGWGLIRPSNTTPCITLRFEAEDEAALQGIQGGFRQLIRHVAPQLAIPF